MRMDLSGGWFGDPISFRSEIGTGMVDSQAIDRIMVDAVRATRCSGAIICQRIGDDFTIVASVMDRAFQSHHGLNDAPLGRITVRTVDPLRPQTIDLDGPGMAAVRFSAAASIRSQDESYLIVLHGSERAPLSPAQTYVLRAHSAHLATVFELAELRKRIGQTGFEQQANVERLRLLESVAIHARDSIIITEAEPIDLPGPRILYCNAAFTKTTGYTAAEIVGQTPRILQGPGTDPQSRAKLRRALSSWEPIEIEMLNYRKDGTEFWVELSIVPVANDHGWFTHWVSVQRDITERKESEILVQRVRDAVIENSILATEIRERKRIEEELLYTAFHDNLTQLRNRPYFMERLVAAMSGDHASCSVLFIDLDQFKIVNDSLGHSEGDALLQEIARRLRTCVRPHDTLARVGGDEFAILVTDRSGPEIPVQIAERIIVAMRSPVQLGRQSVFPSCSIGIAHSVDGGIPPEDLIRDADIAMYEAKRAGYGDYAIFDASMREKAVDRLSLQSDLHNAIERNEFNLVYQAIVDPVTNVIRGFEALVRWNHPERGVISPDEFIPMAEKIGLIRQIDRYVMREGCSQLAVWQRRFSMPELSLSINTSVAEFTDADFLHELSATLSEFGIAPCHLQLEITEGIFLHPSRGIVETIAAVRKLGVRIALDDFGTGYSSLSYINRYPIDAIKIDKSFIDDVCVNPQTFAIVELIIKLGRALSLEIVAEGVESKSQFDLLSGIGCGAIQGFYFIPPVSANEVLEILNLGQRPVVNSYEKEIR